MRIGELASRAGCDVQTVRYYERAGLLDAPARDASGYRRYERRHLTRLHFIRHCRSLDVPLPQVRQLLAYSASPDPSCARVDELLDEQIALVQGRIEALRRLETQLTALRRSCDGDRSRPCAILESFMSAAAQGGCACHPGDERRGAPVHARRPASRPSRERSARPLRRSQ